jgi:type II secretory ATPase GspE/PulE/Tfp pilus assembly ATPase PilB-like protein
MSQLPVLVTRAEPRLPESADAPVVRIQKMIFDEAASLDASDVHIEPAKLVTRIRYRVNGKLRETLEIPRWMHDNLIARIKVLARLDIAERRLPQDGHIQGEEDGDPDVRVSTLPARWGEKAVLRLLRKGRSLMPLAQLGFHPDLEERLHALVRRPQGILLVVGPTGSGKTTTLYALINEVRQEPVNIVTIEDPIEYEVDGITQVQVQEKAGLTFSRALRAILRQDPDVILVGEIRDSDTAQTAFHAAMTGHLVLSTLHATDSISAVLRLRELGIERSLLAAATIGVIGQRLARLNCLACAEPEHPRPVYLERLGIECSEQRELRVSAGCTVCNSSGSGGRAGLYELLEIRGRVRECIESGSDSGLRQAARADGMSSVTDQAVTLVRGGRVSAYEAYRTCYFGGE